MSSASYTGNMKLIFALGNPEARYDKTRHNVGFQVVEAWAGARDASWKLSTKHKAQLAEVTLGDEKIIIAKPTTYYNLVGESLQSLMAFYRIDPSNVLVVHDDLGLDFGVIRTRIGGSGGGSNGIRSLNTHGGDQTIRLRIGIKNPLLARIDSADFVLSRFSAAEAEQLADMITCASSLIDDFIDDSLELTTHLWS